MVKRGMSGWDRKEEKMSPVFYILLMFAGAMLPLTFNKKSKIAFLYVWLCGANFAAGLIGLLIN